MKYILIPLLIWAPVGHSKEEKNWVLTEQSLIAALKEAPEVQALNESSVRSKFNEENFLENYQTKWTTEARLQDSNESAIASFIPTFGPTYYFATGLEKKSLQGVALSANVFSDQQSTNDRVIDQATRTGVLVEASLDLWKNLFGRTDKALLKDLRLQRKKQMMESDINHRVFELELRKTYWSLVANAEQLKISRKLLQTAQAQLRDGLKRQGQFIADKAEIAKFRAQVSSRLSTIDSLEFQRELLYQTLKDQLPQLANVKMNLGPYDVPSKVTEILLCARNLTAYKTVPWQNTRVDELLELIDQSYQQKKKVNARYSDVDLQLTSQLQVSGVDRGYSNSFDDFSNNGEAGYAVGLKLTVPLGGTQRRAKRHKEDADYLKFRSDRGKLEAQVRSRHTQTIKLAGLLQASIINLEKNSANLEESIRHGRAKFKQARIPLNTLITDQDALLNSRLAEIDTKLNVLKVFYDYFQTFTEDPCPSNNGLTVASLGGRQ